MVPWLGLALIPLLALGAPLPNAAAADRVCIHSCGTAKAGCIADARARRPALRAACTGSGKVRRQCLHQADKTVGTARHACGTFRQICQACCAGAGTDCTARCGDGIVTPSRGETCEPTGAGCPGGAVCGADCRCPVVPTTLPPTTTTAPPPPTTTTVPPPGPATFAVSPDTAWFASSFPGFNILQGSASGALTLATAPSGAGDATLAIAADSVFGVRFIGDTILCFQLLAAGSSGLLHCDGAATGVDVEWRLDSNGVGPTLSSVLALALGGPSEPGAGFVVASTRSVACTLGVAGGDPGCLAPLGGPEDCRDPARVRYAGAPFALALTTGSATATVANPRADSNPETVPTVADGTPFACLAGARLGGTVALAVPLPAVDLAAIGDWTSVGVLHLTRTP
jgi:hypothetical protein